MKPLLWTVFGGIPFCVALGLGAQYFSEGGSLLEPPAASKVSQGVSPPDHSIPIGPNASNRIADDQPLPLNEVIPELEFLAAPIHESSELADKSFEQLQEEAEQLIQQADELALLLNEGLMPSLSPSPAELAEVEQHPDFKASLEREAALEELLTPSY